MAKILEIITNIKLFLNSQETIDKYRNSKEDFTRSSKLGFTNTALLGIQLMKGSLSSDIYNVLTYNDLSDVTKSAYSQSRYKISNKIYTKMNNIFINSLYEKSESLSSEDLGNYLYIKKYRGYKIHAIDGSKLTLPNTNVMKKAFGIQKGGGKVTKTETAMCLFMCCYDVLNHYITDCSLNTLATGELTVAKKGVQSLDSEAITIFDRAYASMFFCYLLQKYDKPFIIRVKVSFNKVVKAFVASDKTDSIVTFESDKSEEFDGEIMPKGTKIQVRLVKIALPNGQTEVLMTSLFDTNTFSIATLDELYQMRWGIETTFDRLKNQLLLTCFTGLKPEAIYQDVFATVFVHNLQQAIVNEAQVIVNEATTKCKDEYQVNNNVAAGILKNKIMKLFLSKEPKEILEELIRIFAQNRLAKKKSKTPQKRIKSIAKRRNLTTQANFRRAC